MPLDVLWGAVQRVCAPESWGPLIRAVAIAETDLPPERRQYKVMATIDSETVQGATPPQFVPPLVQAREPMFIGIDVKPDATVRIRVWRGTEVDSVYATCTVAQALRRQLPQALAEAVAMAITRLPQGPA